MCSLGSETPRSALPSLVQTTKPPVSAMAKLTPVSPASACMNLSRRCLPGRLGQIFRIGRAGGGAQMLVEQLRRRPLSSDGSPAARCGWAARRPSCTIRSPRSLSTTSMPCRSRNGFRWHSSVSIDLLFTTRRTPCCCRISSTIWLCSAASAAQWTVRAQPRGLGARTVRDNRPAATWCGL